jgi:ABC-2 type transport system ATP-binding protein
MAYINLRDIVKRYDSKLAVDNINLSIEKGEVFGLLGPNGAGKSTTIKMIMGLLRPNSGEITVDGKDIRKEELAIKRMMGLVPQDLAIYENLSARENMEYFARLYGLKGKVLKERTEETLEFVGLSDKQKEKPKKFSGGMKRRLNIACAIVHQPAIVIMDEPTIGIDPQSRNHILNSIQELNRRGATIIYTSHYMEEVEMICDRVGIIDHGKLITCGTKKEIKGQMSFEEKIVIDALSVNYNAIEEIKAVKGVKTAAVNENTLEIITGNAQESLQDILFILSKRDVRVKDIHLKEADLESVFLAMTGRNLRD